MKVLFITNLPSPYRVDFFNELGKYCDLSVCFERKSASDREKSWKGCQAISFQEIYADVKPIGNDKSIGNGILKVIKSECFDHLIISGYASPSVMLAIAYCRIKKIPFYIESDGGFNKKDKYPKSILKKFLLCKAKGHFTTCNEHINYLLSIGVNKKDIVKYPFTSLKNSEILNFIPSFREKNKLREKLSIKEKKMVLSVGQFIHRKGYDILLNAAKNLPDDTGIYIVGGIPTDEYLQLKSKHTYFIDFMSKEKLKEWYLAADCFVLPTREDIWGLVINEAMACGLPVITTDRCIAGLELIRDGENGYIIPIEDSSILASRINDIFAEQSTVDSFGETSLEIITNYTIEAMARVHIEHLEGL